MLKSGDLLSFAIRFSMLSDVSDRVPRFNLTSSPMPIV